MLLCSEKRKSIVDFRHFHSVLIIIIIMKMMMMMMLLIIVESNNYSILSTMAELNYKAPEAV